jgi:putative N6-adenine-specific DNA methylase
MSISQTDHPFFASAAPGLDSIVFCELTTLGFKPRHEHGGAFWKGSWRDLYRACVGLRTAETVLVRIKSCPVKTFAELETELKSLPWERWVARQELFRVSATCQASALYHEGAVEERLAEWITQKTSGRWVGLEKSPDSNDDPTLRSPRFAQHFVVKIDRDQLFLSVDACGVPLHRRGYRLASAKAPLRETLAAGLVLASGWVPAVNEGQGRGAAVRFKPPGAPLNDPFCGSGTIPIEAALIARKIPPALANPLFKPRLFAFQSWQDFDELAWNKTVESFQNHILTTSPIPVFASDRDEGALASARANAERAGVAKDVQFSHQAFSATEWTSGTFVVTNPPWGLRVSNDSDLRDLFAALGAKLRSSSGVHATWLDGSEVGAKATGINWKEVFRTNNSGLLVRALRADF